MACTSWYHPAQHLRKPRLAQTARVYWPLLNHGRLGLAGSRLPGFQTCAAVWVTLGGRASAFGGGGDGRPFSLNSRAETPRALVCARRNAQRLVLAGELHNTSFASAKAQIDCKHIPLHAGVCEHLAGFLSTLIAPCSAMLSPKRRAQWNGTKCLTEFPTNSARRPCLRSTSCRSSRRTAWRPTRSACGHTAAATLWTAATCTLAEQLSDIASVVATLPAPPILVGHSIGGFIAQR